jgi:ribosomal protein S18 acetylase RimI-like enzyme
VAEVCCRSATGDDFEVIAHLHAQSWRDDYRGIYSDEFLDGDVLTDRLRVWKERLTAAGPDRVTVVAEHDGTVVGFIHIIRDADPNWGAVVQNIHVARDWQGRGAGSRLLAQASRPLFAMVREDNPRARAFYESRGGVVTGRELGGPFPDGSRVTVLRYVWR